MDTKQFIASLVSSLAWPAAVVAVAFLFRKQLATLLTSGPLKRLKAGPFELELDRIAAVVEERVEAGEPGLPEPTGATGPTGPAEPTRAKGPTGPAEPREQGAEEPERRVDAPKVDGAYWRREGMRDAARGAPQGSPLRDFAERASIWPPGAVMEGFQTVEMALYELVSSAEQSDEAFQLGAGALARRAVKLGIISEATAEAVDGVAVLRNLVAHGRDKEVTEERALEYLSLVDAVLFAIRRDAERWQQGGN